jgi:hypothetical protein
MQHWQALYPKLSESNAAQERFKPALIKARTAFAGGCPEKTSM